MKRLLLKRILPFVMAMIMLASFCFPAGAFTIDSSGKTEEDKPYYTIEFNEGVLRVKLNPQKVYDALSDGDLTRAEIEQFIPKDVLDTLEGGVSKDALLTLASEYINAEEIEKLLALLPENLLSKYFLNPEFLEQLITLDEVLALVNVDALLSGIQDQEKFNRELNALLTPVLGDLLTEKVKKNLLADQKFMEGVLADAIDRLLAEHETEVMNVLPELVTDGVVNSILSNESYKNALIDAAGGKIKEKVMGDATLRKKLADYMMTFAPAPGEEIADDNPLKQLLDNEDLLTLIEEHPEWLMTKETVAYIFDTRSDILTNDALIGIFGEAALRDVIKQDDYAVLHELMKSETLMKDLITDPEFYTVASTVVTDEIVNKLVNSADFDVFEYMTESELAALLEGKTLVLTNAVKEGVTSEQISDFLKEYEDITASSLIQKEYLNPQKINISALDLNLTTLYEDMEDADRQAILDTYGIDDAYVEDYILNSDSLSDDDRLAIVTNAWFSFDALIDNGYGFLISEMADDKGITLQSMLEKELVDTGALLKKYPDSITLEELLADREALKVASILNDADYGIKIADILAAKLVDVDRVLSDSNIEISDLALSGTVLSAMAQDALEIDGVEQLLKDSFFAHIENGDIDPVDFLQHVDLAAIAKSTEVDLSGLIHALVDPKEGDTPEQAAIKEKRIHDLQALVQLTAADYRAIFGKMSYGNILDALSPHTAEMIEKMGIDPFLDCFGAITLIDVLFATPEKSGMMALIDGGVLSLDQVAIAIGGVEKPEANDAEKKKAGLAILAGKVDAKLVIEKLGDLLMQYVTFAQIVEYAGGYQTVLGWYSTEELNAIVQKVGTQKLFILIKDNGILQSSAAKDAAKTVIKEILKDKENLKSFVKGLKTPLTQIIVEEIASMKINDTTFFKNGLIDLEEAVRAVINAIPDVETFCNMKAGDVIVGMVLHTEFRNDDTMTVGVEVSFDGDFTELQKLAEQQKDLFCIEVGEDDLDIHVSSVLPGKVAALYGKVLESEKLPADLKGKLLSLFDKTLPEMVEVFTDLSDEEIAKLSETVNDKLDAVLEKADGAVEKLPGQVADRVDALLGKLRTVEGMKELIEKLEKAVDKLPEKAKSFSLFGMYEGSGEFVMDPVSFKLNIEEKISEKLDLPAGMLKADLDGSFSANVTFKGLYSLTFLDREGNSTVFILPAGADLDVLKNVPGLDLTVFGENVPATMPAMDTIVTPEREEHEYELIFELHYPDGTKKMLDRITYNKDATELPRVPETPGAIRGYRVVWDDYGSMLGASESQIVSVRYQLVIYELIFVKGDKTVKVPFTVESIDNIKLPETDDAGTGAYYTWTVGGKAWTLDEIKAYLKDSKNELDSFGSFEQEKDYHVYTISFYDLAGELFHTVEYTVLGLNDGEFMPKLPGASAGHKNFWWNDTDKVKFNPDTFDCNTAKDLDVYVKADLLSYTYVFKFADPSKADVVLEYTAETSWEEFSKLIPALSENAADGDYTYSWSINVESDFPRFEEATVVQEIKTYKRYSITFETSEGTEIVYYYSTDDSASIIAKFPELSDSSAALGSGWYLDANGNGEYDAGEEWDPDSFDVSLKKDLVVKERFSYIDYTYTFFYLDGRMIEITVNATTDRAWLKSQIEAHTATERGYRNVWNDGEKTWNPDGFAATDAYLQDLILIEQTELIEYVIHFWDGSIDRGELRYTVESDWDELKKQIYRLDEDTLAVRNYWIHDVNNNGDYDKGGPDYEWNPDTFNVSYAQNMTIRSQSDYIMYSYHFNFLDGRWYGTEVSALTSKYEFVNNRAPEAKGYYHTSAAPGYTNVWMYNGRVWTPDQYKQDNSALMFKEFFEVAVPNNYTITFDKLTGEDKRVTYTIETNWADKIGEIPALEPNTEEQIFGWYVDLNGNGAYDAGEQWDPATFDVTSIRNFTVKEYWIPGRYSVYFQPLVGEKVEIVVTGTTTKEQFLAQIPDLGTAAAGYENVWLLNGSAWNPESFVPADESLIGATLVATTRAIVYELYFDLSIGEKWLYYTVETDWNELKKQIPTLGDPTTVWRYLWYIDVNGNEQYDSDGPDYEWLPDAFDVRSMQNLVIREGGTWREYTYRFIFLDGRVYTTTIIRETTADEFRTKLAPEANGYYHTPNENGYQNVWMCNGSLWETGQFGGGDKAGALENKDFYEVAIPYTYTIFFDKLEGTDKTLSYTVESNWADLMTEIPALETNTIERLYGWYVDLNGNGEYDAGETWSPDTFDVSAAKSFTVKEYWIVGEYDVVFKPLVGPEVTIRVNGLTTKQEFLAMIPDLSVAAAGYKNVWMLNGAEWDPESFVAADGALIGQTIVEKRIAINYTITFDKLVGANEEMIYNVESLWSELVGEIPALTPNTLLRAYGWYVDANANGEFDAGEEWNPETFDVGAAKSFTVKEYCKLIDYKLTFAYLNGTKAELILNAETTKQEFLAMVPDLSAAATGYKNAWKLDGADWNPESFVEGSDAWVGKTVVETAIPLEYTITYVPLKNNTTGVAGTAVTETYTVLTESLTKVPALHTVTNKNDKLYTAYLWYVDANGNGRFDAGEEWDPANFDASVATNLTVYEYGVAIDYTMVLKPIVATRSESDVTIIYNANNWPEVYEQITALLHVPTGDEIGSFTYDWYYVATNGNFVKQTFTATLSNTNAEKLAKTYTELRRVENNNRLYVFDRDGNKLAEYYYTKSGIYQRDDLGVDNLVVDFVTAPDVVYYTFSHWVYAGNKLNAPEATDTKFEFDSFLEDLGIDLSTQGTASNRRINVMAAYKAQEFTLTFKADGKEDVLVKYTVETDKKTLAVPAAPDATLQLTYAWYLDANGNGRYDAGEEWDRSKLNTTNPTDLTLLVYSYPTVHTYTFAHDGNVFEHVTYTYLTTPQEFLAMVPVNTVATKAYTYAWYVDVNGNGQFDDGEEWSAVRFCENGLGDYEVKEYRIPNKYTITFVSFNGTRTEVSYTVETLKSEILAGMPTQTEQTVKYCYYWAKGTERWTVDDFLASECSDYEIVEMQEGRTYTLTFVPMKEKDGSYDTPISLNYKADMTPDALALLIPQNNASSLAWDYYWFRDLNDNGVYDEGEEWTPYTMDWENPDSYTVYQRREAHIYTMTFQPLVGEKVTIEYSVNDQKTWKNKITSQIPTLTAATGDEAGVYEYAWYYADSEGKLTKRAATYFNSCTSNSKLRDMAQDFVETKRILETNKIVFYGMNGKPADRLVTYYFDRDKVVYHDELNREIEVEKDAQGNYLLPVAPELLGYVFNRWVYGGNKATSATATDIPFSLETFREDFGVEFGMNDKGTAAKANTVNAIAVYELIPYTLTFKQEGKPDCVIRYNVESKKADIEAEMPNIPESDALFTYRVLDEEGRLWFFGNFDPQNNPGNYVITIEVTPVEYMMSFVRADGSRDRFFYTGLTTRAEFEEMMPKLINNDAFTSAWIMDGEVWSVERLFGSSNTVGEELIGNYTVEEVQVAHSFMLTFRDMSGALITQVIYNGHGPIFGTIPELPSSADGYNYYWWNTTGDAKWDGFDPMAAKNLELTLRRDPITYVLNFQMPNGTVETRTYTVLDQSFQLPTATAPRGRELRWYYMEGENKIWWTKDDLYVGDLDLIGSFELIDYTVTFKPGKGADIVFVMTIEDRREPSVSPKPYYTGEWYVQLGDAPADTDRKWHDYDLPDGGKEVTVYLRYTAIPFRVTFFGLNGEFLAALEYAVDGEWIPAINAPESDRAGYVYKWFIKDGKKLIAWENYELAGGSYDIQAVPQYVLKNYNVSFQMPDGTVVPDTATLESKPAPSIPGAPAGYKGVWYVQVGDAPAENDPKLADYDLTTGGDDVIAYSKYEAIRYKLTFEADDKTVGTKGYTVEDEWEAPAVPRKPGYTGEWYVQNEAGRWIKWEEYSLEDGATSVNVKARYSLIRYEVTFTLPNGQSQTRVMSYSGKSQPGISATAPAGYSYAWYVQVGEEPADNDIPWTNYALERYNRTEITVYVKNVPLKYKLQFMVGDRVLGTLPYTVESEWVAPDAPARAGYIATWFVQVGDKKVAWNDYDLKKGERELTIVAEYTLIQYQVSFVGEDGGATLMEMPFNGKTQPAVPAKPGYTGEWYVSIGDELIKWSEYELQTTDGIEVTVVAQYEIIRYQITFKNEAGEDVVLDLTVEDEKTAPTVPAKPGYTGEWYVIVGDEQIKWNEFDLTDAEGTEIEVELIYTAIQYQVTFKDEAGEDVVLDMTVEDQTAPAVPAKPGYTGEWYVIVGDEQVKWSDFNLADAEDTEIEVELIYTAIQYQVTFKDEAGKETVLGATVENKNQPEIPKKAGFIGAWYVQMGDAPADSDPKWSDYDLTAGGTEIKAYLKYTPRSFNVDYEDGSGNNGSFDYDVEDEWKSPEVPPKGGYTGEWFVVVDGVKIPWNEYVPDDDEHELSAVIQYTPIEYVITFKGEVEDDNVVLTITVEDVKTQPGVNVRPGYTGGWYIQVGENWIEWNEYALENSDGTAIDAVLRYVPIEYTVTFKDGETSTTLGMTVENKTQPALPVKPGYTVAWGVQDGDNWIEWSQYALENTDGTEIEAVARYVAVEYAVTFKDDTGKETLVVMTVENKTQPAITDKLGYTGKWYVQDGETLIEWTEYALSDTEGTALEVVLRYTLNRYTATFYGENGQVIGTTTFTIEDKELQNVPEPPAKEGYTVEWEAYTIGAADLEIHAIYTPDAHGVLFGIHWIWWLLIVILLILILLTLIYILVLRKRKLAAAVAAAAVEEPEAEPEVVIPVVDVDLKSAETPAFEPVETIDADTADTMMEDETAMAVLETVGGAQKTGLKSIVNISEINDAFDAGETVDVDALKAKNMVPAKTARLKVLGGGHLDKPLTVVADAFSVQAIKMITLTGGKAVQKKVGK